MGKRNIVILIIIILVIGGTIYCLSRIKKETPESTLFREDNSVSVPLTKETIDSISKNINQLSPEKPVLGGSWHLIRFSLIDKSRLYVEYGDNQNTRQLLLQKKDDLWQVIGFFHSGKDMWKLVSGSDPYMGANVSIYEVDLKTGEWKLIN
ncbi:MAG: hypothetical protein WC242_01215 [Candidatus Paceibacterota bacterium]|jgi:hypothetical protein